MKHFCLILEIVSRETILPLARRAGFGVEGVEGLRGGGRGGRTRFLLGLSFTSGAGFWAPGVSLGWGEH